MVLPFLIGFNIKRNNNTQALNKRESWSRLESNYKLKQVIKLPVLGRGGVGREQNVLDDAGVMLCVHGSWRSLHIHLHKVTILQKYRTKTLKNIFPIHKIFFLEQTPCTTFHILYCIQLLKWTKYTILGSWHHAMGQLQGGADNSPRYAQKCVL